MKRSVIPAIAVAVLALTSCATAPEEAPDPYFAFSSVESAAQYAEAKGHTQQAALLADGEATEEDYRAANSLFRGCLEELGYRFGPDIAVDPINGLQLHNTWEVVPEVNVATEAEHCQDAFDTVEMSYIGTHEKRMDAALRASVEMCASSHGIEIGDDAMTIDAMLEERGDDQRATIEGCLFSETERLFPALEFAGY
ncbi:hypothetical protein FVA74_13350 [Salinibacterium sp. dk2585]|uniref:hypothetical protein n=1 Tax=unclassified Salinibacterium TaxID=2632331 RepID=UPI0011C252EC|nr:MULTISPECIES: hypothetical protein [unclassified Salinibacterium]QEE62448.1 hypothetical protein FVA74_13350 [Salinibacterium sp. dk2585]TXK52669.1 hypothetical protein FVP63_12045 [Salinibacterium sp. dk5596]